MRIVDGLASIVDGVWVTLGFDGTVNRPCIYKVLRSTYLGRPGILFAYDRFYLIQYTGGFIRYDSLKNDSLIFGFDGSVQCQSETNISSQDGTYLFLPNALVMDHRIYKEQE